MKKRLYSVNNWRVGLYSGCMTHQYSDETKRLGEYQLKLLDILLQHAGEIFSRDQLTHLVWEKRVIGNNSLPNAIHTLRSVLNDNKKQQRIIQTIPKKGYLLDASYCIAIEQEDPSSANEGIHPTNIPFACEVAARQPGGPIAMSVDNYVIRRAPAANNTPASKAKGITSLMTIIMMRIRSKTDNIITTLFSQLKKIAFSWQ